MVCGGGYNRLLISNIQRILEKALQTIYSVASVFAVYWAVNRFIEGKKTVPDWMINISNYCMGVYVFQQFILIGLYYHSPLPSLCGTYALPWVGFAVTVPASFAIAYLMRQTKVGRYLIG